MFTFTLLLAPLFIGIAFYLYFFLKGIYEIAGLDIHKKLIQVSLVVFTLVLTLLATQISGFGAILILHIVMMAFIVQFVNFIIKLIARKKYKDGFSIWKNIYKSRCIPILLAVAAMIFGYFNLHNVVETNYTVYTDKSIREQGYRVALIADVHFGVSIDSEELTEKCSEISQKNVDLVVLCGDIVDNLTTSEQMHSVFEILGGIRSTYGTFYVHGNHDRPMSMISSRFTEDELVDTIQKNGIIILQDNIIQITDDFVVIGREDRSVERNGVERTSIEELIGQIDSNDFILTLDHQPNQYIENAASGTDLLLSGHTHGGQLFPLDIVQEIIPFNDGVYGMYELDGDSKAIVTSGVAGWAYPIKTAAPAEYVIIDIKNK